MSQLVDIKVHPMRWRLRLSHGVNQEIHSMAIISQDAIKLGCSGGQGKIQIQTFFEHAAQLVQQLRLRRTSVENPRQRRVNPPNRWRVNPPNRWRVNLYKLVYLWRDRPVFLQNKANFKTEVRKQKTEDR